MEGYDSHGNPLVQGIVAATAVLTSSGTLGEKSQLAQRLEAAMTEAITQAAADGVTDPVRIKALMMDAYTLVRNED